MASETTVKVDKKSKTVTIVLPLETPRESGSGKNLVIASTRGNMRDVATFDGKSVTIGVNVYIPND